MFSSNACFSTCIHISQEAAQVVWYSHLLKNFPQCVVIHTVKSFSIVNEAVVEDFLKFSCFFSDTMDMGNLISGSSAFSKSSLYIWKFSVHILLKLSWRILYYLARMWNEGNCIVVWTFFGMAILWLWNETELFPYCDYCWVFQICWRIEYNILTASCFRILNGLAGIPSPPLALFIVMLPKAH